MHDFVPGWPFRSNHRHQTNDQGMACKIVCRHALILRGFDIGNNPDQLETLHAA
jgi:hypothetical protein